MHTSIHTAMHTHALTTMIQGHIWGGKGVGSQGDGAAQFIARSKDDQERVCAMLEMELGMRTFKLTIS